MYSALAMQDIPAIPIPDPCPGCAEGLIVDGACTDCGLLPSWLGYTETNERALAQDWQSQPLGSSPWVDPQTVCAAAGCGRNPRHGLTHCDDCVNNKFFTQPIR